MLRDTVVLEQKMAFPKLFPESGMPEVFQKHLGVLEHEDCLSLEVILSCTIPEMTALYK